MLTEKMIRDAAKVLDIPMVGVTDALPLTEHISHLEQRAFTPFCHSEPEKRVDYRSVFPEAKGVITIGMPYALIRPGGDEAGTKGRIASFAVGRDYHLVVREKLEALAQALMDDHGKFEYRIFVDDAKLCDRAAAHRAGLGFFGKNNLLINPTYGSAFTIGQLIVNVPIEYEPATPMESCCGSCTKCLVACPSKALLHNNDMDTGRCISYLTQKKRLSSEEESLLQKQVFIYGCDRCQWVCPFNQKVIEKSQAGSSFPDLEAILSMESSDFDEAFGESALHWRGLDVLKRNAKLAMSRAMK